MAALIVGEEPCTIQKIVNIMSKSSTISVLCTNWQKFARSLQVPEVSILKLKNDLRLGVSNLDDLLVDLLHVWVGKYGNDATLETLCKALTDCNSKDTADKVENEFVEILKAHILATGEVSVHGKVLKVSDIFNSPADLPPEITKIFKNKEPIQILKDFQIPNRPRYYIQRTVSPRTQLNPAIFKSASSDVFVLENLDWSTLDDKLFGSNVERSSTQTVCVTAKFILLDFEKDYERICQVVIPTSTPVHLVRFDSGSYYWVRSRGSLAIIQQHVSTEQAHLSEEEFVVNYLNKFQNAPVCIAETPGMGKSLLLASIAQGVHETHPDRVVLFMVLRELEQSTNSQSADPFWKLITTSDFAAEVLKRLIESGRLQFELFLDGFDEVLPTQIDNVNQLFLNLKQYKNIRIYVTTRPHMRNQLEQTLGVLGYTILPFSDDNQVDFLSRFWGKCDESRGEELNDSRLESFARQCLEMLKKNMSGLEHDIAGIPLQCAMLAEVYAYDAVTYSMKESSTEFELTCKVESIFQMFQQLMRKKMERVQSLSDFEKQELYRAHVHEAVKLIFPSWVDKMTCIQIQTIWRRLVSKLQQHFFAPQSEYSGSFLANLYAVGLMEPSSSDAGASPRFVHRTFAEFLIAEHLVKHLKCRPCSRLLLDAVLADLTTDSKNEFMFVSFMDIPGSCGYDYENDFLQLKFFEFSQNVIAYFVNAHLGVVGTDFQAASLRPIQNVDEMLSACCLNNYSSIFKGLSNEVLSGHVDSTAWTWTDMSLLAARYSEANLMEQLVQIIQRIKGKQLSELEFPKEDFGFPVTPLHVAVQRGSYIMTRYLMNKVYTSLESLPYLLHCCVYRSTNNSDAVVKDKIEIIKFLVGRNKDLVHERLPGSNATPLLLPNVHVDLIQALIELGANVNAVDSEGDTLLHIIFEYDMEFYPITAAGYFKVFNLIRSSNFNLWDTTGKDNETPLHLEVKSIEEEHSVLDQYSNLSVDFNHVLIKYGSEYSVLFAAIRWDRPASFITKLEQNGADVNYLNPDGESALHIAAKYGNYDVARYLVTDRNFDVNHRDCDRLTPLHVAILYASPSHIKIQALLIDNGAELEDPEYKWRPTPLYYALSEGSGLSLDIVKKMVEKGLGAEHLALALDLFVKNEDLKAKGKGSEYSKLFRYLYKHGGRIQNTAKKLEQHKCEFVEAIFAINDQLLEQLKVAERTDEVVLEGICSTTDLYESIISEKIQLECVMLALLECNQLKAFETISELLQYKEPKFESVLPGLEEFILTGNNMIVVVALDLELCLKRVTDTIFWVEEYQEGVQLLPGTLCFVKVQNQEHNFREYLEGLAQLPYRFIVFCEKSLAAVVEGTHQVVRDHIEWNDLTMKYQDELIQVECIGFQLSQESKEELFVILRDESLIEVMRNGRVSTDHLGRIIQNLVEQLHEQQLKVLEKYNFKRLFPSELAEIMNADSDYDEDEAREELIGSIDDIYEEECIGWFFAARMVLNARFNDQQQMQQVLKFVFECVFVEKRFHFKNQLLVYCMDWLVGYKFSFDFQPDYLDKHTIACLRSNAVNLIKHLFSIPNKRVFFIPLILNILVYETARLDASQLELRVNLVLRIIMENPETVKCSQDNLSPMLMQLIHVELIDLLIYTGANVHAVNEEGCNFVHVAASCLPSEQFQQLVRYLVDHRLTELLNAGDSKQWTPLFYLTQYSNPDPSTLQVVELAGADFNATAEDGHTLLFYAVKWNKLVETLEALVERGADWRKRTQENFNLLHLAADEGNLEATKYFVKVGLHVNSRDDALRTPLMYALINTKKGCNVEIVKFLLESDADVNAANKYGNTALSLAVRFNRSVTILEALVDCGADWSWKSSNDNTLLQLAAIRGNLEVVKYFVKLGCNVNARDNDLDTPLISAVAYVNESIDNIEVVKFLLEHGADVNAANNVGHTALYYANKLNHSNICKLLTCNGATCLS